MIKVSSSTEEGFRPIKVILEFTTAEDAIKIHNLLNVGEVVDHYDIREMASSVREIIREGLGPKGMEGASISFSKRRHAMKDDFKRY